MEKAVSAADANRNLSELLRGVRQGRSYVVTSHGKPIARLVPLESSNPVAAGARTALLARLHSQRPVDIGRWKREDLYEDVK